MAMRPSPVALRIPGQRRSLEEHWIPCLYVTVSARLTTPTWALVHHFIGAAKEKQDNSKVQTQVLEWTRARAVFEGEVR
jgi:hypothetical protein